MMESCERQMLWHGVTVLVEICDVSLFYITPRLPVVQLSITVPLAPPHRNFRLWYSHLEDTIIRIYLNLNWKKSYLNFTHDMTTEIMLQCLLKRLFLKKHTKLKVLCYHKSFPFAKEEIERRENGKKTQTRRDNHIYLLTSILYVPEQIFQCNTLRHHTLRCFYDIMFQAERTVKTHAEPSMSTFERSTTIFSSQYQCIAKQTGNENWENHQPGDVLM